MNNHVDCIPTSKARCWKLKSHILVFSASALIWLVVVESLALNNGGRTTLTSRKLQTLQGKLSSHQEVMKMIEPYLDLHFKGNIENKKSVMQVKRYIREACSENTHNRSSSTQKRKRRMAPLNVDQCALVLDFLTNNFSIETVGTILLSYPRILRRNPQSQLSPTILFLSEIYTGKNGSVEDAIRKNPSLLLVRGVGHHNIDNGSEKLELILKDELGMSIKKLENLKRMKPQTFEYSPDNFREVCFFIASIIENGHTKAENFDRTSCRQPLNLCEPTLKILRKVLSSDPCLFSCNVQTNLSPTIVYLRDKFGISSAAISSLIKICPGILGLSIEKNLSPKLRFFQEEMGLQSLSELSRCTSRHPQILALSLSNLQEKVYFFNNIDRLSNVDLNEKRSLAYRISIQHPTIFSLSLSLNIIPKIVCLSNMWGLYFPKYFEDRNWTFDSNHQDETGTFSISQLMSEYPAILTSSLEDNILPTINFFNSTGYIQLDNDGRSMFSVNDISPSGKRSVVRGRVLASSLYNTLLPRWQFLKEKEKFREGVSKLPPLYILATSSDDKFCDYFNLSRDELSSFKEEMIPELKFCAQFAQWMKTGKQIN